MRRRDFILALPALAACGPPGARLNVFNWSNYVAPDTIPRFEREAGVRVRYATYESNEEMLARVLSGNSGWDVVFPSNYFIRPMLENGLLAELDPRWLPNLDHLDPAFRHPQWDPQLRWSVPYMWGATGIAFQPGCGNLSRWADMWDERWRGRMTMLDDPGEVLGAGLKKLGFPLNSRDPGQLRAAQREAVLQKPLLRAYLNTEVRDQLVSGDVLVAQAWNITAVQTMEARPGLRFVLPEEGFALYADNMAILRESGRVRLAHRLVDYLLRPEVAAQVASQAHTATANSSARRLLPARHPMLYPPPDVMARGEWFETPPPGIQRLRDRLWTEIKSS